MLNEKPKATWPISWKEFSLCHKLWIYNPYIFETKWRKSFIFQTYIIWYNRIYSLKYLRSTTLESKDIGLRKAEFVANTQFLYWGIRNQMFTNWAVINNAFYQVLFTETSDRNESKINLNFGSETTFWW